MIEDNVYMESLKDNFEDFDASTVEIKRKKSF